MINHWMVILKDIKKMDNSRWDRVKKPQDNLIDIMNILNYYCDHINDVKSEIYSIKYYYSDMDLLMVSLIDGEVKRVVFRAVESYKQMFDLISAFLDGMDTQRNGQYIGS